MEIASDSVNRYDHGILNRVHGRDLPQLQHAFTARQYLPPANPEQASHGAAIATLIAATGL